MTRTRVERVLTVGLVAFCVCAVTSIATVSVNFRSTAQVNQSDGSTALPLGSIWQLIWAPSSNITALSASDPLTPQGGEILLLQITNNTFAGFILAGDGSGTSSYEAENGYGGADDDFVGGFVYGRIFDFQGTGNPTAGTWYADVGLFGALGDQDPGPAVTTDANMAGTVMNQQIAAIPEPTVLAFMGVGVALMLLRLRRRV